jgi:beta-glucuronidase
VFRITDGGTVIDEYSEDIGIRTVEVRGADILLNGKPVYLKGFGKHEDSDINGRGYNPAVIKRDFELMKWIGANSFRTAHYPYSEEIYQMADREGFLVIDETAAVGMMTSTLNFMDAANGNPTAFFQKETTAQLLKNHLAAIEELIRRDKNHACVIAWCLANEPETTDESALPYLKKAFAHARLLDAQKRPCLFTSLMTATPDKCKCIQLCDIVCLNRYYGWYVKGGYEISDAENWMRGELEGWKNKCPGKPFVFTEYGADTDSGLHKLPSVMWSQEYQIEYLEMCHRVFDSFDFIKGEQVWNFADFQTTEGIMRVDGNRKGIFTRSRQPKAAAFYLKKRWENLPCGYKGKQE